MARFQQLLGRQIAAGSPEAATVILVNALHGCTVAMRDCLAYGDAGTGDWRRFDAKFDQVLAELDGRPLTDEQQVVLKRSIETARSLRALWKQKDTGPMGFEIWTPTRVVGQTAGTVRINTAGALRLSTADLRSAEITGESCVLLIDKVGRKLGLRARRMASEPTVKLRYNKGGAMAFLPAASALQVLAYAKGQSCTVPVTLDPSQKTLVITLTK